MTVTNDETDDARAARQGNALLKAVSLTPEGFGLTDFTNYQKLLANGYVISITIRSATIDATDDAEADE